MVSKDILLMGGVGERLSMTSSEDENLQAQTMVLQHSTTATQHNCNPSKMEPQTNSSFFGGFRHQIIIDIIDNH